MFMIIGQYEIFSEENNIICYLLQTDIFNYGEKISVLLN